VNEEKDGEAGRADKDGEGAGLVGWSRSRASSPSLPSERLQCIITVYIYGPIDYYVALGFWSPGIRPSLGQFLGPPLIPFSKS
jgi:hypothetical protein